MKTLQIKVEAPKLTVAQRKTLCLVANSGRSFNEPELAELHAAGLIAPNMMWGWQLTDAGRAALRGEP